MGVVHTLVYTSFYYYRTTGILLLLATHKAKSEERRASITRLHILETCILVLVKCILVVW